MLEEQCRVLGVQRGMLDGTSRRGRVSGCPGHVQGHGDDQLPRRKSLRRRSRVAPVSLLALRSLGGFPGLMAERRKGSVSPEVPVHRLGRGKGEGGIGG